MQELHIPEKIPESAINHWNLWLNNPLTKLPQQDRLYITCDDAHTVKDQMLNWIKDVLMSKKDDELHVYSVLLFMQYLLSLHPNNYWIWCDDVEIMKYIMSYRQYDDQEQFWLLHIPDTYIDQYPQIIAHLLPYEINALADFFDMCIDEKDMTSQDSNFEEIPVINKRAFGTKIMDKMMCFSENSNIFNTIVTAEDLVPKIVNAESNLYENALLLEPCKRIADRVAIHSPAIFDQYIDATHNDTTVVQQQLRTHQIARAIATAYREMLENPEILTNTTFSTTFLHMYRAYIANGDIGKNAFYITYDDTIQSYAIARDTGNREPVPVRQQNEWLAAWDNMPNTPIKKALKTLLLLDLPIESPAYHQLQQDATPKDDALQLSLDFHAWDIAKKHLTTLLEGKIPELQHTIVPCEW